AEHEIMIQELSALAWPIRYRLLTRDGYYLDRDGERVHFTTAARGLDARRGVSLVLMRAAVLLVIVAGLGYRRAAWLLKELFHVEVSKSALHRWVEEIATSLPDSDEIITALDAKQPITEAHFDEIFPRGSNACVLVLKDEHGRIIATKEVDKRDEATVTPFLQRMKDLGLNLSAFYIDGCKAYYNAIRSVFGEAVAIQYDYFHVLQNVWRQLWKWAVARRQKIRASSEQATTPWYKKKLEALAKSLWENRYLLFKAEARMSAEERARLAEIVEAERHVGKLRAFLGGVWRIFEDSTDEQQARLALAELKRMPVDREHPEPFRKVVNYLEEHFEWMTAFLRYKGVKRNSLAESGMRVLRRLEVEHDGFRSEKGRENCLRIYQAVKYLGWSVHQLPQSVANTS
ncbi:MAG: transposase, partial [Acidobacteria bacterium]|nr:transposase [Acidobacteriota bacterium]